VRLPAATAILLLAAPAALAVTIHVPGDQPTIQAGIDAAAAGDTVEVACGTYYEHDILLQTDLTLRSESGDPSCVTIDAARSGRALEVAGVSAAIIEGLTITQGLKLSFGGGIYVHEASATITRCSFVENEVGPSSGFGGGVAFANAQMGNTVEAKVTHCSFVSNRANQSGGGLAVRGSGDNIDVMMSHCTFSQNTASAAGALYLWSCSPVVSDCVFVGNSALSFDGGAISRYFGATALFSRCLLAANDAFRGSAFDFFLEAGDEATVSGCTIVANTGPIGAIEVTAGRPVPDFENTLIAWNEGVSFHNVCLNAPPPQLSCCNIYGNAGGDWIDCIADQSATAGNFSADPLFCDAEGGDFTLSSQSPCLPGNHPDGADCGLIGTLGQRCGPVSIEQGTWAVIKARYRR